MPNISCNCVCHKVVNPMNIDIDVVVILFQLHLQEMQNVPF